MQWKIRKPDDLHHHFRDGEQLTAIVPLVSKQFARALAMPNTTPPVLTADDALKYKEKILAALPLGQQLIPLMTLYLTDNTSKQNLVDAKEKGIVGCKLYPANATTNSAFGVSNIDAISGALEAMEELDLLLLIHGEVLVDSETGETVDIFKREARFMNEVLPVLVEKYPKLRIVCEHITTKEAVETVLSFAEGTKIAATITPQHLLYSRSKLFEGNLIRPHNFCLPILKSDKHHRALKDLIKRFISGDLEPFHRRRFFLGTDSAAHPVKNKLDKGGGNCGCAGVFSAPTAVEYYLEAFEKAAEEGTDLEKVVKAFEVFSSENGALFYGLPLTSERVTVEKKETKIPSKISFGVESHKDYFVPLDAGNTVGWNCSS